MGNISTILAALFCATAPFSSIEAPMLKTESSQSNFKLGRETVSGIRASYESGKYNSFFDEMDQSYKNADLTDFIQMRQSKTTPELQEKWEQQFINLQKKRNLELLQVIEDRDDSLLTQKVRSLTAQISTPEQEKAISRLNSFIVMAPGTGANEDENTLIALDLEYEYKALEVGAPLSGLSSSQKEEYLIALRMEKMDKMLAASKNFQDHSLKQAVGMAANQLDARLARNIDGADLNRLAKAKASNSNEEAVYSIISSYQGQLSDLMKQIDS
jgi:hypothetical protein